MNALVLALALGFSSPDSFQKPAAVGGGGGRLFTGSPSSKWDCSVCHDADEALSLVLAADPPTLLTQGYTPGQTYRLTVTLGAGEALNGAFGMEVTGRSGASAGQLGNIPASELEAYEKCVYPKIGGGTIESDVVVLRPGGTAAQTATCNTGTRSWRLQWTAPDSDVGGITFYVSAVAGNANSANTGDRTVSRVFGVPSPGTMTQRTQGCGAPAVIVLLPLLGLVALRRRSAILLVLIASVSFGAAKKKKKAKAPPPRPPASAPAVQQEETPPIDAAPAPAPVEPAKVSAPPTLSEPAPLTPTLSPQGEREVAVVEPPPPPGPPALDVAAFAGFGFRGLALYSESFATPIRLQLGFPVGALRVRAHPFRLMRVGALGGFQLEGEYQVGYAIGGLPLGAAVALPAAGHLAAGYRIDAGAVSITPRFVYRIEVGGVEKNTLFDDPFYQSIGGELALAVQAGGFFFEASPGGGAVLDTGTLSTKGYGKPATGLTAGGRATVGWRFSNGLLLSARYTLSFTKVAFAGYGERDYGPLTSVDLVHVGALSLSLAR